MIGVLGGGLAGVTVAAHLDAPCEVLESESRCGGHCASVVEQGFTFDAGGPHIMFSRDELLLGYMKAVLGDNLVCGRRENKVYYKGRYVKYPFENGLYDLDPQDRFECLYSYLNNSHRAPANFREWMYHTFGTGITEKYLLPYNEKIWKAAPDTMSTDWVDGRIPKPPVEDIIKAAVGVETEGYTHQLYFWYPAHGGIEALPAAIARGVPRLSPGYRIRAIRKTADGWAVSDGRETRYYETLVATIPIPLMARIVEGVPREIQDCAAALPYNSLITVTLGFEGSELPPYTAVYVPEAEYIFHRLSFPGLFSPNNVPAGKSLVQAEITSAPDGYEWQLTDSEAIARVLEGLARMQLGSEDRLCYARVMRTRYGYVVRDFTYSQNLARVRDYFEGSLGIVLCGRVAEFEYINMDQCIGRAMRVAETMNRTKRMKQYA